MESKKELNLNDLENVTGGYTPNQYMINQITFGTIQFFEALKKMKIQKGDDQAYEYLQTALEEQGLSSAQISEIMDEYLKRGDGIYDYLKTKGINIK